MIVIKSTLQKNPVTGEPEIIPVIPFSEFPTGPREAGPDESGNLVWCVNIAD